MAIAAFSSDSRKGRVVMTLVNESLFDRAIRILAGIALSVLAWITWPGTVAMVSAVVAAIAFVTGFVGWCPAYTLFGISTEEKEVSV
jgi:hypothetical protein